MTAQIEGRRDRSKQNLPGSIALYAAKLDKEWSLTDCILFVVMKEHGLEEALTGDHHFNQAGFRAVFMR